MKKLFLVAIFIVSFTLLNACAPAKTYYFASITPTADSSWVSWVVITKEGNQIVDASWNAFNIEGDSNLTYQGLDKYSASVQGIYDMTPNAEQNGKLWWHEQANLITKRLIDTQNVNDREPVPSGASVDTNDFYVLAELALASKPIDAGNFENGYHFITLPETSHSAVNYWDPVSQKAISTGVWNTHSFGSFVVVNGRIVLAYFNNEFWGYRVQFGSDNKIIQHTITAEDNLNGIELVVGDKLSVITTYATPTPKLYKTKNQLGTSYGMAASTGGLEYFQQALNAGTYLIENQTFPPLSGNYFDEDAGTGVTIRANDFYAIYNILLGVN